MFYHIIIYIYLQLFHSRATKKSWKFSTSKSSRD